ncbi:MAG: 5-dehydro-4-deoxyglucarate dehydratase [Specibacter sp.]
MTTSSLRQLDGVLYFPVTPFAPDGSIDEGNFVDHVRSRLGYNPGAVFAACGTGEFHALSSTEVLQVVRAAVRTADGAVPVIAGAGGQLGHAIECAKGAAIAGADALLILPPYLVSGTADGLVAYVQAIIAASGLPVIVYHRGAANFTTAAIRALAEEPLVIGFKDGVGDIGRMQEIVREVHSTGRSDVQFFNGLLTAELTQGAYRGLGVPLYSSAAFAMAPDIAMAHYSAYVSGDEARRLEILDAFYLPLVALRDQTPGFGVSLVKAGLRLRGQDVGSVRAPLVDPDARQLQELERILSVGETLAGVR